MVHEPRFCKFNIVSYALMKSFSRIQSHRLDSGLIPAAATAYRSMTTPNILNRTHRISPSSSNCIIIIPSAIILSTSTLVNTVNIIVSFFSVQSSVLRASCHACRIMPHRRFNLKPIEATGEFAHVESQLQSSIEPVVLMPDERHHRQRDRRSNNPGYEVWPPENTRLCEKLHGKKGQVVIICSFILIFI
jgi:hypothetical protein